MFPGRVLHQKEEPERDGTLDRQRKRGGFDRINKAGDQWEGRERNQKPGVSMTYYVWRKINGRMQRVEVDAEEFNQPHRMEEEGAPYDPALDRPSRDDIMEEWAMGWTGIETRLR